MNKMIKRMTLAGALALGMTAMAPLTASAGEWRLNANRCPDLREDLRDMRHDHGWKDRREDVRDYRVVNCPARAWSYYPSRGERWNEKRYRNAYPKQVIVYSNGRVYQRNHHGDLVSLGINLRLG